MLLAPGDANNLEGNSFSSIIKTCSSLMLALLVTRIILVCGQSEMLFLVQCMRSSSSLGCSDGCQRGRHRSQPAWSVQQAMNLRSFNLRWMYLLDRVWGEMWPQKYLRSGWLVEGMFLCVQKPLDKDVWIMEPYVTGSCVLPQTPQSCHLQITIEHNNLQSKIKMK